MTKLIIIIIRISIIMHDNDDFHGDQWYLICSLEFVLEEAETQMLKDFWDRENNSCSLPKWK